MLIVGVVADLDILRNPSIVSPFTSKPSHIPSQLVKGTLDTYLYEHILLAITYDGLLSSTAMYCVPAKQCLSTIKQQASLKQQNQALIMNHKACMLEFNSNCYQTELMTYYYVLSVFKNAGQFG